MVGLSVETLTIPQKLFESASFVYRATANYSDAVKKGDRLIISAETKAKEGELCFVLVDLEPLVMRFNRGLEGQVLGKVLGIIRVF